MINDIVVGIDIWNEKFKRNYKFFNLLLWVRVIFVVIEKRVVSGILLSNK